MAMTDRETNIRQNVQEALEAFGQTERIKPDPWFHRRVMNKIQSLPATAPNQWSMFSLQLLKPALLITMVVLNLSFVSKAYQQNNQELREDYVSYLVSDYGYANMDDMFTVNE
jgi:hypothetical protein